MKPKGFVGRRIKPQYQYRLEDALEKYGFGVPEEDEDRDPFQAFAIEPPEGRKAFFKYLAEGKYFSADDLADFLEAVLTEEAK